MPRPLLLLLIVVPAGSFARAQADAQPLQKLIGHTAGVYNVAYSPDGKLLASAGKDRKIHLWNPADGQAVRVLEGHTDTVYRVCFSPDGKILASAGDQSVRLWDPATGKVLQTLAASAVVYNLTFHPDGKRIAGSMTDGHIRIWDLDDGKLVRVQRVHTDRVLGIAYSPDGKLLATSSGTTTSGDLILWDAATGQEVRRLGGTRGVMAIAFAPSGATLAAGLTDKTVRLWEVSTGRQILKLEGHTDQTYFVAFSPDGRRLASCGGNWNNDKASEIILWDIVAGERLTSFNAHTTPIWTLAYHPHGKQLASASGKWSGATFPGEVRLWGLEGVRSGEPPAPTADLVRVWWADLHGEDAGKAYRAGWNLSHSGNLTLPLMAESVKPPRSITPAQIARWIIDLDHDDCDVRDAATLALESAGSQSRTAVVAALDSPAPERQRRARQILERITDVSLSAEEIHALRELEVLARVGPSARSLVERYMASSETTPVGGEARRILRTFPREPRP